MIKEMTGLGPAGAEKWMRRWTDARAHRSCLINNSQLD